MISFTSTAYSSRPKPETINKEDKQMVELDLERDLPKILEAIQDFPEDGDKEASLNTAIARIPAL